MKSASFREKIREKISDEALQAALDANAERRVQGRIKAIESLSDWDDRRTRAHAVRAEIIAHLDEYLDRFIARVTQNEIVVHRANDAIEAIKIFLAIIESEQNHSQAVHDSQLLIAKSKSMVTEEIHLNQAIEKAGHKVVETDLGEYIIQLRGERPSHIITPASHLRRHEVGELFHKELNVPYTEDIPTLTNTARKMLREVFLNADVGVSGVNFGVAESGTLTLVTNEGNGRMVTSLPPIHIAVMGIERLVPTLSDLALMLSLLPRSATGQKISVYTQLIHKPGLNQEKHLILVDNGRSQVRDSRLHEILYCIRCGSCLNACPVFREIGGHGYLGTDSSIAPYPGPIGSVVSPGLFGDNYFQLAQASSLCGACKDACPIDIDLPKLLTRVRAGKNENQGNALPAIIKFSLHVFTRIATRPGLFALSQRFAGLGTRLLSPLSAWIKLPAFTGWGYSKDIPRPAFRSFRDKWPSIKKMSAIHTDSNQINDQVDKNTPAEKTETDLIDQFARELTALNGHITLCKEDELAKKIIALLHKNKISRVQTWNKIPELNIDRLKEAGIRIQHEANENIKAGITGALAGIAETGTLVIPCNQDQPGTASLLPEIHIAVLRSSDIESDLDNIVNHRNLENYPSVVLVSGPSRTADIEMTLTIGVHGPGKLHVFVLYS